MAVDSKHILSTSRSRHVQVQYTTDEEVCRCQSCRLGSFKSRHVTGREFNAALTSTKQVAGSSEDRDAHPGTFRKISFTILTNLPHQLPHQAAFPTMNFYWAVGGQKALLLDALNKLLKCLYFLTCSSEGGGTVTVNGLQGSTPCDEML